MFRFDPSVRDQCTATTPVFLVDEGGDAIGVRCRIATREYHPQKIVQLSGRELAVVHDDEPRELVKRRLSGLFPAEARDRLLARAPIGGTLHS